MENKKYELEFAESVTHFEKWLYFAGNEGEDLASFAEALELYLKIRLSWLLFSSGHLEKKEEIDRLISVFKEKYLDKSRLAMLLKAKKTVDSWIK